MNLTDEQLLKIEESAACFMPAEEIAVLIDQPVQEFLLILKDESSQAYRYYQRGKVNQKLKLRKRVIETASYGSHSAAQMVESYIVEQTKSERNAGKKIP